MMSEEIIVIGRSELRKLIREELEDFYAANELLGKSNQPIPISTHEKLISLEEVRKTVGCSAPKQALIWQFISMIHHFHFENDG
jgi:hypothetical protein